MDLILTEKSGKLCLDTRDNYVRAMEPHINPHQISNMVEVRESEAILNQHAKAWISIMAVGTNAGEGQHKRCRDAMKVTDSGIPTLEGMRKDHKQGEYPNGPPLRPLANAWVGPNANLGNLMCRIIRPIREELRDRIGTEVLNSEEMLRKIQDFNSNSSIDIRNEHER